MCFQIPLCQSAPNDKIKKKTAFLFCSIWFFLVTCYLFATLFVYFPPLLPSSWLLIYFVVLFRWINLKLLCLCLLVLPTMSIQQISNLMIETWSVLVVVLLKTKKRERELTCRKREDFKKKNNAVICPEWVLLSPPLISIALWFDVCCFFDPTLWTNLNVCFCVSVSTTNSVHSLISNWKTRQEIKSKNNKNTSIISFY